MSTLKPRYVPTIIKLFSFPVRDGAECIRYMCAYQSISYQDVQISREEWNSSNIDEDTPFGNLPVMHLDGNHRIAGTIPIMRCLASMFHFLPESEIEQAKADMYAEVLNDLAEKLRPVTHMAFGLKDAEKKKLEWDKYKQDELIPKLKKLELCFGQNKCLCGNKVSWVDVMWAEFLDRLVSCFENEEPSTFLKEFPCLNALKINIHQTPSIKVYLQYKPKMEY